MPSTTTARNRSDARTTIITACVIIGLTAFDLGRALFKGVIDTALSAAIPEGIHWSELNTGPAVCYGIGLTLKVLGIVGICIFLIRAARPMLRGEIFTRSNARNLSSASWCVVIWVVGQFAFELIGDNLAAHQFGIDWWYDQLHTSQLGLALPLGFITCLTLFTVVIRRGITLEEDVDGLV
ncbi:hypothetical protein [uncultured Corynebacterium sp.]|uniref:hypothetical protein n=1 Tax=uncultured Corynebacterium sp. TaxID=159447 RepID=UPI0025D83AA8|nr:hypothetical protein [uncultured Corynebacterium sp.]